MSKCFDISLFLSICSALLSSPVLAQDQPDEADITSQRQEQVGEWQLDDTTFADGTRTAFLTRTIGDATAFYAVISNAQRLARITTETCGLSVSFAAGATDARVSGAAEQFAGIYSDPDAPCSVGTPDGSLSEEALRPAVSMLEGLVAERPFPAWMVWDTIQGSTQNGDSGLGVSHFENGLIVQYLAPVQPGGAADVIIRMFECDALWEDKTEVSPPNSARAAQIATERLTYFAADCGFDAELPTRFVEGLEEAYARAEAAERARLAENID